MFVGSQRTDLGKLRCIATLSFLGLFIGGFLFVVGIIQTATGYAHRPGSFFYEYSGTQRTAGPILLVMGFLVVALSAYGIHYFRKKRQEGITNMSQTTTMITSGTQPTVPSYGPAVPGQYPSQPHQAPYPPAGPQAPYTPAPLPGQYPTPQPGYNPYPTSGYHPVPTAPDVEKSAALPPSYNDVVGN